MVNRFAATKRSAQFFLHYIAMLRYFATVYINLNISVPIFRPKAIFVVYRILARTLAITWIAERRIVVTLSRPLIYLFAWVFAAIISAIFWHFKLVS